VLSELDVQCDFQELSKALSIHTLRKMEGTVLPVPVRDLLLLPEDDFRAFVTEYCLPGECKDLLDDARRGEQLLIIPEEYHSRRRDTKAKFQKFLEMQRLERKTIKFLQKQRTRAYDRQRKEADRRRYEAEAKKHRTLLHLARVSQDLSRLRAVIASCDAIKTSAVRKLLRDDLSAAKACLQMHEQLSTA